MRFADRTDAGKQLVRVVEHLAGPETVVLGLPRGGLPVAKEVATSLHLPLDAILVRKLGVPGQPELAMGAIGEGRVKVMNGDVVRMTGVSAEEVRHVEERERAELERRRRLYRAEGAMKDLAGRTALIVDDGIATGATARAACAVARELGAARVAVAVPVAPSGWASDFEGVADETLCLYEPAHFLSVGHFYEDFAQVTDDDVVAILRTSGSPSPGRDDPPGEKVIPVGEGISLRGILQVPDDPKGLVVFVHGSGSSRRSPRNAHVADELRGRGIATLLFDLLTDSEAGDRANVFDIGMLAERLGRVVDWTRDQSDVAGLAVALYGASTGAAAALEYAAAPLSEVAAVVSRGGRPDLAGDALSKVRCPVLLIVGEDDTLVLGWNRSAKREIGPHCDLVVVPGATHLFEEPGTLEKAAEAAGRFLGDVFDGTTHRQAGGARRASR